MHHSRMTQWETWSHTIYTQGPSLLSISNYFPTGLTHQSETFLWVYFPDDFSEAGAFFFRPSAFHLVGDEKGQCASKVKVCWWRLPPFEALSLGNRCVPCPASQTLPDWINSMCVCSSNCRLFWSNKSIFHTASTLTQSLIWWRIFLSLLQNGRYI